MALVPLTEHGWFTPADYPRTMWAQRSAKKAQWLHKICLELRRLFKAPIQIFSMSISIVSNALHSTTRQDWILGRVSVSANGSRTRVLSDLTTWLNSWGVHMAVPRAVYQYMSICTQARRTACQNWFDRLIDSCFEWNCSTFSDSFDAQ